MRYHRHKFNAKQVEYDGFKFPSKKEGEYYQDLKLRQLSGEIIFFLRQVPFHLPGNTKYVIDFVEFHSDGTVHFCDVKGHRTPEFIKNKKMVENLYPITIEVIK